MEQPKGRERASVRPYRRPGTARQTTSSGPERCECAVSVCMQAAPSARSSHRPSARPLRHPVLDYTIRTEDNANRDDERDYTMSTWERVGTRFRAHAPRRLASHLDHHTVCVRGHAHARTRHERRSATRSGREYAQCQGGCEAESSAICWSSFSTRFDLGPPVKASLNSGSWTKGTLFGPVTCSLGVYS